MKWDPRNRGIQSHMTNTGKIGILPNPNLCLNAWGSQTEPSASRLVRCVLHVFLFNLITFVLGSQFFFLPMRPILRMGNFKALSSLRYYMTLKTTSNLLHRCALRRLRFFLRWSGVRASHGRRVQLPRERAKFEVVSIPNLPWMLFAPFLRTKISPPAYPNRWLRVS